MNLCKRHDLLVDARDRQTDFPYYFIFLFFFNLTTVVGRLAGLGGILLRCYRKMRSARQWMQWVDTATKSKEDSILLCACWLIRILCITR